MVGTETWSLIVMHEKSGRLRRRECGKNRGVERKKAETGRFSYMQTYNQLLGIINWAIRNVAFKDWNLVFHNFCQNALLTMLVTAK